MAEPPEHTDRLVGASARPRGAGWTFLGPKRLKREFISQITGLGPFRCSVSPADGAVVVRRSCTRQFRRVRPVGPCLRAPELHSRTGVWVTPHRTPLPGARRRPTAFLPLPFSNRHLS